MHFIYSLTILPLELLFGIAYQFCVSIIGSFGFSLIALSLLVASIYLPLHKVVQKAQNEEREIEEEMASQLANIKASYTGAKRHEAILHLYHRYGYHPIMAIRSAFGILLQVPFLMAAYYMVTHLTMLQGESFFFIKDLSLPDGLLYGINLLPLAMTALNIITAFITPRSTKREKIQGLFIAGLFLWLLYPAPSALMVYWTCNNFIYLLESLIAKRKEVKHVYHNKSLPLKCFKKTTPNGYKAQEGLTQPCGFFSKDFVLSQSQKAVIQNILNISVFTLCLLYFFSTNSIFYLLAQGTINDLTVFAITSHIYRFVSFIVCLTSIFAIKNLLLKHHKGLTYGIAIRKLLILIALTLLVLVLTEKKFVENATPEVDQGIFIAFLWAPLIFSLIAILLSYTASELNSSLQKNLAFPSAIYFSSIIAFASNFYALLPTKLFLSEPEFFTFSFTTYMGNLFPCFIAFCAFFAILWLKLPKIARSWLAIFVLTVVIFSTFVCFVWTVDYGALDIAVFKVPEKLLTVNSLKADMLALFSTFIVLFFVFHFKKIQKFMILYLIGTSIFAFGYTGFVAISPNINKSNCELLTEKTSKELLPPYHKQLWELSKKEKNIIVILFDQFTGSDINEIVAIEPSLKDRLDGFVWYPDTIAAGESTYISTPAVYAGNAFAPRELDKSYDGEDLYTKVNRAYYLLANSFADAGYNVALAGLPYSNEEQKARHLKSKDALVLLHSNFDDAYVPYWKHAMNQEQAKEADANMMTSYFTTLSSFRLMPHTFRAKFYDDGEWCDKMTDIAVTSKDRVVSTVSAVQFMADFVNTNAKRPTFKFIYSCLTHPPYCLPPSSTIPVAEPGKDIEPAILAEYGLAPSHTFSELHALRFVARLCEKLKKEGVYDNTRIIIVSDHCNQDSIMLSIAFGMDWEAVKEELRHTAYEEEKIHRLINFGSTQNIYPGNPHAVMLVKDFNSRGGLSQNNFLLTNGDAASFAINGLLQLENIPTGQAFLNIISDKNRKRMHAISEDSNPKRNSHSSYNYSAIYKVTGTMFKKENWIKIK